MSKRSSLYANRPKAYPRFINHGIFRRLKWLMVVLTLAVYWLGPWLRWDRGPGAPDQAILIDLPGRRAYFFFIEIWPQEVYYLTGILIISALLLFFISALLGRVWCGFACWQTVFTDVFVWIERLFQGERNARMSLDKEPMSFDKLWRKTATHIGWIIVAGGFGLGFILYFEDAPTLVRNLIHGDAGVVQYVFMGLMSFFCYLLAGYARENVCIYMCPYARFQAAMFDEHSMIVAYEGWRGEPRGLVKGKPDFTGRGHCVDCKMCIQVCPTGIDIREGSQLACIGCALCIDACNQVMDRFSLPRGLISYDSIYNQQARSVGDTVSKTRMLRPRVYIYVAILTLVTSAMVYTFSTRKTFDVSTLHERTPVYVELSGNRLRNGYTVKVLNMMRKQGRFVLTTEGLKDATLSVIGIDGEGKNEVELPVSPDSVGTFRLFITAPKDSVPSKAVPLTVKVVDLDTGRSMSHENLFAGPEQ
ncbi:MAG TPA: cytochrome c oxidase accessory protein CcoG [Candidatus Sulfotelmatobacter sp.]|jgi:cytochrome c oxidase accessory protein FixG|nr:cytochrome c oxidase accessory protein CcoG [Candidatus Sulfotelmatobacter sp.]